MFSSPTARLYRVALLPLLGGAISVAFIASHRLQPVASASSAAPNNAIRYAAKEALVPVDNTIYVNSTADIQNNSDGLCTLREAIGAANTDTASGATAGECVAGSGTDTIDLSGVTGTIILTTGLPFINSDLTITGPGANNLTVQRSTADGTPRFRIFTIASYGGPQPPTVNISGLTITNGYSVDGVNASDGGGVSASLDTTVNLTNMVIRGNTTGNGNPGSGGGGGGVFNFGTMTITGSTISGNTTGNGGSDPGAFGGYGGGISNAGTLTLTNTTVSGNSTGNSVSSTQGGYGGGIYSTIGRTVTLLNCTISNNHTGLGGLGGGINNGGTANLKDTIVANNAISGSGSGPDLSGSFTSQDFNLIEDASGASVIGVTTHNITGVDPLLGPLAANGGSTLTHALLVGSPAIDAANSSLTTDQRGLPRPIDDINAANVPGGNASDIGAFEGHSYEVNSTADTSDGQCAGVATGNGCTLREAITAANNEVGAELITFAPSLTAGGPAEIELLNALPTLVSDVLIIGPGASQLTIRRSSADGTPTFRIFTVASGIAANISGLTVTNGHTNDGTVASSGSLLLQGLSGGGISNGGTLNLTNVIVTGNSTGNGAATTPSSISFAGQGGNGGGVFNSGTLTMTDCTVSGNQTGNGGLGGNGNSQYGGPGGDGGGIYSSGPLTMTRVTVSNNTNGNGNTGGVGGAGGSGGGVAHSDLLTITDCMISGNMTGQGGVGSNAGASSASSGSGGGILGLFFPTGTLVMKTSTVTGNRTADGAAAGSGSSSGTGGGVVINYNASGKIINSTISNNRTGDGLAPVAQGGFGGGVYNGGTLEIIGSAISGNQTGASSPGGGSLGGGIENDSSLTVTNSTISGNRSGGIGGYGGGIVNNRTLTLNNVTVTNNTSFANVGHGISAFSFLATPPHVRNSIIAGNGVGQSGSDVSGDFTSDGNNLVGNADNSTGFNAAGDQTGTSSAPLNALLGPLANNGGLTQTHALLPGSPAINAGGNANLPPDTFDLNNNGNTTEPIPFDQRGVGFNRIVNGAVDIGAFESRGFTISATSGTPQGTAIGATFGLPLVATVSSSFSEPVANGVVTFSAPTSGASGTFPGSVTSVNVITNDSGVAISPAFTANLITGSYNVGAGGSGIGSPISFSLTNTAAGSTTTVLSSANPSNFGDNITFTATVTPAVSITPTGTVQFKDGVNNLGSPVTCAAASANTCTAQLSTSTLSVGNHSISATYSGDGNFLSSSGSVAGGQVVNCVTTSVTNTNDSGAGSLRQAILGACPGNTITFAANLTSGGPATITLTSGQLLIDKNLTIIGPGADLLSVSGNAASRIFNVQTGVVTIAKLAIVNGQVGNGQTGGGVFNKASLTLIACAITGNTSPVGGGGILNASMTDPATLTIIDSTISGNKGGSFGSGLFNSGTGTATANLINTTVTGNTDTSFGGGIYNDASSGTAVLNITNSTIAGNIVGSQGGGIYNFGNNGAGTVNLNNSIIADNIAPAGNGPDISNFNGNLSGSNNIIKNSGQHTITGSNNSNVDPLLQKDGARTLILKNNGGPTKTLLPLHTSPAINAGSNALLPSDTLDLDNDGNTAEPLPVDQRGPGFNRIVNSTVDIGAVEVNYTITANAGTPQSALITTAFATQLQARVQESGINQSDIAVTFTPPASGPSGSFSASATVNTNASGLATAPVFTANNVASGPYNVVASLAGGSPSTNFALTNLRIPTTTSVSSSVNPSEFGQGVTLTATVSSNVGTPTGSVQFIDGGVNLGAAQTLNGGGVAQLTTSSLTSGTHLISAEYLGNDQRLGSTGNLQNGQVVKPQPTLSINDVTITEGNSGTSNLSFTVTLSAASNLTVNVNYATANGTATTADNDYQSASGLLTFNPGDLSKPITVVVNGDQKTEADETLFIVLSNPVNAAFSASQGTGTILNDDTLYLLLDTSGPDANQLAAFESLLLVRDPFRVQSIAGWWSLGAEKNTRVSIFATNLTLNAGETASAVTVNVLDSNNQSYDVAAEDVRAVPNLSLVQVTFRLPDGLPAGTCQVTIKAHGQTSNTGSFRIAP